MSDGRAARRAFVDAGFVVVRTPALPIAAFLALGDGLAAATVDAAAPESVLVAALGRDRELVSARLRAAFASAPHLEALYVASPSLAAALADENGAADGADAGAKTRATRPRTDEALVRYFARMCTRATPFGLFAGCSVAELAARTDDFELSLSAPARWQRRVRLDMDYLFALCERLAVVLRDALIFEPNSSLYANAGQLRYAEARVDGRSRSYHLVGVERSEHLEAAVRRAADGVDLATLATHLAVDGVSLDDAAAFAATLVEHQVLVPRLHPLVTGDEPLADIVAQLQATRGGEPAARLLGQARAQLAAIEAAAPGVAPARYASVAAGLEALPVAADPARLFQVDVVKPLERAHLGRQVMAEIERGIEVIRRFAVATPDPLQGFRDAFVERYEGQSVRLVDALDDHSGVGARPGAHAVDAPFLADLALAPPEAAGGSALGPRAKLLQARLLDAARTGAQVIDLDARAIDALADPSPGELTDTFSVMATVLAASPEALASGAFSVVVRGPSGPSGANILGRFCHADPALAAHVRRYLDAEAAFDPDAVFAEIVHLPEGRIGNVLLRPLLRTHELPYLGRSGAPREQQIALDDLWVSVERGQIVLRSRRLGRRVVPRLTTAHNFAHGLGPYAFLCALQRQSAGAFAFTWMGLDAPFLPRVTAGRLVLARARWRIDEAELAALGSAGGDVARWRAVQALRRDRQLPRHVAVEDGDNELVVDLDNVVSVDSFVQLVHRRATLRLLEPLLDACGVQGEGGAYAHELVVPYTRVAAPQPSPSSLAPSLAPPTIQRRFVPGSSCLYVKLFGGAAQLDGVLRDVIAPVVREATTSGAISRWFFLRYADPHWHLRVRLFGAPARLLGEVLPAFERATAPLLADHRLWRLQIDTYEREVERYGGEQAIELVERIFCADAEAVLGLVAEDAEVGGPSTARAQLTLLGLDRTLDDLGCSLEDKLAVITPLRDAFAREHRLVGAAAVAIGDKFRRERRGLEALLSEPAPAGDWTLSARRQLVARSSAWADALAALREASHARRLTKPLHELAGSVLHMHANRMLPAAARAQEAVLYDFLGRIYTSRLARARQRDATST